MTPEEILAPIVQAIIDVDPTGESPLFRTRESVPTVEWICQWIRDQKRSE